MNKKRNQTFVYLYVLAILMVIDDHCGTRIGFLSGIFPYNSFYMPLFVFASGYFYRPGRLWDAIEHKTKKFAIPFIIYDAVMILLALIIDSIFNTRWSRSVSLKTILRMLAGHPTTTLNGAAWFVMMLFWVSIGYCIIRAVFFESRLNDYLLTAIFILCGFVSLYICILLPVDEREVLKVIRGLCKIAFYIQFYHLGYMFNRYGESLLNRLKKRDVCLFCVAVNVFLIMIYGDQINFYETEGMESFHSVVLPLITSVTGILFYYEVMSFLSGKIGERKELSFIGRNTFVIMEVHLLFVNIPNFYVYHAIVHGSSKYNDFPVDQFVNNTWVRYSPNTKLAGFFCGVIGSLIIAYLLERAKRLYQKSLPSGHSM